MGAGPLASSYVEVEGVGGAASVPSEAVLEALEEQCNEAIREEVQVQVHLMEKGEERERSASNHIVLLSDLLA